MHVADPIYGPISIHDIDILQLIDTKAFQRLAYIKQQGHTYFLHENAIHTREEHSIGVYVLVNKVIEHLTEIGDIHLSKYERKLDLHLIFAENNVNTDHVQHHVEELQ
nr:hypothetical protein [Bacillus toyonensis]